MITESPIEAELLVALLPHGWIATGYELGPWRLSTQKEVVIDEHQYRIDIALVSPFKRIAVECDGAQWHSSPDDAAKDAARDRALVLDGWTVLRFTGREIHRTPDACARDVMKAMGVGGRESASVQGATHKALPVDGACSSELGPPTPMAIERFAERLRAARASIFRETPNE